MKHCTYCGKDYPDDFQVCPVDQQPLRSDTPPTQPSQTPAPVLPPLSTVDRDWIINQEHIRLLSIFHYILAGLGALGLCFLFLHFLFMSTIFSSPEMWRHAHNPPPPAVILPFLMFLYLFLGAIIFIFATLNFLSGLFLQQRKHRIFSIVVGAFNCLQFPFGTVLGVFTFITLTRPSIHKNFRS